MNSNQQKKHSDRCFTPTDLEQFLDSKLDSQKEAYWIEHLESCGECQTMIDQFGSENQLQNDVKEFLSAGTSNPISQSLTDNQQVGLQWIKHILGPTDNPDRIGRIGKYEVAAVVGSGSSGVVIKAFEPDLGRFVALKIIAPTLNSDNSTHQRFQREAKAMASIKDPNVVPVYGIDQYQGYPYIVMQLVTGGNLQSYITNNGPLSIEEAVSVAYQVAKGLSAAHKVGIIHRDIKPGNVLLNGGLERVLVSDFGLARAFDQSTMTRSGVIAGTPEFMSPEQAKSEAIDHRSDLFSLGTLLYCCLTGNSPFRGDSVFSVIKKVVEESPVSLRSKQKNTPEWLSQLVEQLMAKDPQLRFQSAEEVSLILEGELASLRSPSASVQPSRHWMTANPVRSSRKNISILTGVGILVALPFGLLPFLLSPKNGGKLALTAPAKKGKNDDLSHRPTPNRSSYLKNLERLANLKSNIRNSNSGHVIPSLSEAEQSYGRGDYDHTEDVCRTILDSLPNCEQAWLFLGLAQLQNKNYPAAENSFKKLATYPDHVAHAHYNLACVYSLSNQPQKAIQALKQSVKHGYSDYRNILNDRDLSNIQNEKAFIEFVEAKLNRQKDKIEKPTQQEKTSDPQSPQQILTEIIKVAKKESMYREKVDWSELETKIRLQLGQGKTIEELAVPVQQMLYSLGDYHGAVLIDGKRFMAKSKGKPLQRKRKKEIPSDFKLIPKIYKQAMTDKTKIHSKMLKGNIAYIEIPTMGANQSQVHPWGQKIRDALNELLDKKPTGIIIDLRTNLGGNMHPMFAGLGRLYPNIDLGGQTFDGKTIDLTWSIRDGNVYLGELPTTKFKKMDPSEKPNIPVAVLTSRYTCSSGEALASGYLSQKNTRLFGEHTSGYSTCNAWFTINSRVTFSPAVGYYISKNKTVHYDGVTPETEITENLDLKNLTKGKTIDAAKKWILSHKISSQRP